MEVTTATALLSAGADVLIMRHPESLKTIRNLIKEMQ
jgi:CO dehydrogenase/acetyl-CoA synthase delta subunit